MAEITAQWADGNLAKFGNRLGELQHRFPKVLPRIVNQVGERAKTQVIRALTKQTGLKRATIVKAVGNPARAHDGSLAYTMTTKGGNIRLKFFQARETKRGVVARPWGKRTLYAGTFMKGGAFPNRVMAPRLGGNVWLRNNTSGTHITQQRSGVYIPREMTQGATAAAFNAIAAPLLQQRVEAVLVKLLG